MSGTAASDARSDASDGSDASDARDEGCNVYRHARECARRVVASAVSRGDGANRIARGRRRRGGRRRARPHSRARSRIRAIRPARARRDRVVIARVVGDAREGIARAVKSARSIDPSRGNSRRIRGDSSPCARAEAVRRRWTSADRARVFSSWGARSLSARCRRRTARRRDRCG